MIMAGGLFLMISNERSVMLSYNEYYNEPIIWWAKAEVAHRDDGPAFTMGGEELYYKDGFYNGEPRGAWIGSLEL